MTWYCLPACSLNADRAKTEELRDSERNAVRPDALRTAQLYSKFCADCSPPHVSTNALMFSLTADALVTDRTDRPTIDTVGRTADPSSSTETATDA